MKHCGNTLTEYSLAAGLVAVLSIVGVKALGLSTSGLLEKPAQNPTLAKLSNLDFSGGANPAEFSQNVHQAQGPVALKGSGYYGISLDPQTGMPVLGMTDATTGSVTNATSLEGNQWNSLGQFRLADTLEQLAKNEKDPASAAYLTKLSEISYYLGGAEGELDQVPGLNLVDGYTHSDAARDIDTYRQQLQTLMANPPAGMSPETLAKAIPLAADVYNIAQSYHHALQSLPPTPEGMSFRFTSGNRVGEGSPGLLLQAAELQQELFYKSADQTVPKTITESMSISYLKETATQLLSDNKVESALVEATFTDAQHLEKIPTASSTTSSSNSGKGSSGSSSGHSNRGPG